MRVSETPRPGRHRTPTLQQRADRVLQLRIRAVLHEGKHRDKLARRGRKHQPLKLTPRQQRRRPVLTVYLATHDGWPPTVTRDHLARLKALNTMYAQHGPLVLLTVNLDDLDALPLKSEELKELALDILDCALDELAQRRTPHTASIQRGVCGGTHWHLVIPLAYLRPEYAALITAARAGPGGGCLLLKGEVHGVVMLNAPSNRERVARYLSRDPDARLDEPDSVAYLDALEDELTRKATGHRSPRLYRTRGA